MSWSEARSSQNMYSYAALKFLHLRLMSIGQIQTGDTGPISDEELSSIPK